MVSALHRCTIFNLFFLLYFYYTFSTFRYVYFYLFLKQILYFFHCHLILLYPLAPVDTFRYTNTVKPHISNVLVLEQFGSQPSSLRKTCLSCLTTEVSVLYSTTLSCRFHHGSVNCLIIHGSLGLEEHVWLRGVRDRMAFTFRVLRYWFNYIINSSLWKSVPEI